MLNAAARLPRSATFTPPSESAERSQHAPDSAPAPAAATEAEPLLAGRLRDRPVRVVGIVDPRHQVAAQKWLHLAAMSAATGGAAALGTWTASQLTPLQSGEHAMLIASGLMLGGGTGLLMPYLAQEIWYGVASLREWCHLRQHSDGGPAYQLERQVELARRAAPLSWDSLDQCLENIQTLRAASPRSLEGTDVALAFAGLAPAVLPPLQRGFWSDNRFWEQGPPKVLTLFKVLGELHHKEVIDTPALMAAMQALLTQLPAEAPDREAASRLRQYLVEGFFLAISSREAERPDTQRTPEKEAEQEKQFMDELRQLPCLRSLALESEDEVEPAAFEEEAPSPGPATRAAAAAGPTRGDHGGTPTAAAAGL